MSKKFTESAVEDTTLTWFSELGYKVKYGLDFAIPVTLQISRPTNEPDSKGPDYQKYWKKRRKFKK